MIFLKTQYCAAQRLDDPAHDPCTVGTSAQTIAAIFSSHVTFLNTGGTVS